MIWCSIISALSFWVSQCSQFGLWYEHEKHAKQQNRVYLKIWTFFTSLAPRRYLAINVFTFTNLSKRNTGKDKYTLIFWIKLSCRCSQDRLAQSGECPLTKSAIPVWFQVKCLLRPWQYKCATSILQILNQLPGLE